MAENTSPGFGLVGFFLGIFVAGGTYFGVAKLAGASTMTAVIVLAVFAVIGAAYTAIAFSKSIYAVGFFSILGLVLDLSWSMLNTLAAFLVWIPACKIGNANFVTPDEDSKRSGTFVYDSNPRGGGYAATTIGTCIAGGWSSHEENHVWQARLFGPIYMVAYALSWILNVIFKLFTGKVQNIGMEAYYRIPFEDWCYWGASTSGNTFNWGQWFLWFLLTLIYVAALVGIPLGIALGIMPLWAISIMVLVFYSLVRAFAPSGH